MEIIGIAEVKEVFMLLIKTSLNVLFKISPVSASLLKDFCESFNLSKSITVSYKE